MLIVNRMDAEAEFITEWKLCDQNEKSFEMRQALCLPDTSYQNHVFADECMGSSEAHSSTNPALNYFPCTEPVTAVRSTITSTMSLKLNTSSWNWFRFVTNIRWRTMSVASPQSPWRRTVYWVISEWRTLELSISEFHHMIVKALTQTCP